MRLGSLLGRIAARLGRPSASRRPRLVRRTELTCPHTGDPVEVDVQVGPTGRPSLVLRCSARAGCPAACDQACLACAELLTAPARALILLPPGTTGTDEVD